MGIGGAVVTEIIPVKMSIIEDRSAAEVELWVPQSASKFNPQKSLIISNKGQLIAHLESQIDAAKNQIFITTGMIDETLADSLTAAISRGVSLYILIEKVGFSQSVSDLPSNILDGALIRSYDGSLPCSLLIDAGPNKGSGSILRSATRLNRSLDQPATSWAISLNPSQTSSLAAQMISKFWDSKVESESRNSIHADSPQPFSGISPHINASNLPPNWFYSDSLTPPADFLKETALSKVGISSGLTAREMRNTKAEHGIETWSLTCRDQPEEVPSTGRHLIGDCHIKAILTEGNQGIIYDLVADDTSLDSFSSGLRLDEAQTSDLIHNLEPINAVKYEYKPKILLGDLNPETTYLSTTGQESKLVLEETIDAGSNPVETLDSDLLNSSEPHHSNRPDHNPFSLKINWKWVNVPPSTPTAASPSSDENAYSEPISTGLKAITKMRKFADQQKFNPEVKRIDKLPSVDAVRAIRNATELKDWAENLLKIHDDIQKKVDMKRGGDDPDAMEIARGGAKMVNINLPDINKLPTHDLPKSGLLFSHAKSIYLEIADWNDLNQGKAEAEEYGATLVAKKNWNL